MLLSLLSVIFLKPGLIKFGWHRQQQKYTRIIFVAVNKLNRYTKFKRQMLYV